MGFLWFELRVPGFEFSVWFCRLEVPLSGSLGACDSESYLILFIKRGAVSDWQQKCVVECNQKKILHYA